MRDNELARRDPGGRDGVELRGAPLRVKWTLDDLITADDHSLRCVFSCTVRAMDDRVERRMLAEVLLGPRTSVTDADVANYFAPSLRKRAIDEARARARRSGSALRARRPPR